MWNLKRYYKYSMITFKNWLLEANLSPAEEVAKKAKAADLEPNLQNFIYDFAKPVQINGKSHELLIFGQSTSPNFHVITNRDFLNSLEKFVVNFKKVLSLLPQDQKSEMYGKYKKYIIDLKKFQEKLRSSPELFDEYVKFSTERQGQGYGSQIGESKV